MFLNNSVFRRFRVFPLQLIPPYFLARFGNIVFSRLSVKYLSYFIFQTSFLEGNHAILRLKYQNTVKFVFLIIITFAVCSFEVVYSPSMRFWPGPTPRCEDR